MLERNDTPPPQILPDDTSRAAFSVLPLRHTNRGRHMLRRVRPQLRPVHSNSKYLRRYALCRRLKPGRGIVNSRVVLLLRSVEIKPFVLPHVCERDIGLQYVRDMSVTTDTIYIHAYALL